MANMYTVEASRGCYVLEKEVGNRYTLTLVHPESGRPYQVFDLVGWSLADYLYPREGVALGVADLPKPMDVYELSELIEVLDALSSASHDEWPEELRL